MILFHKVFAVAAVALVLAAVAQAVPSSSSATARVKKTAYLKTGAVGITIAGDAVAAKGMCSGLFASNVFTRCRAGGSRYSVTACGWRITQTTDSTSVVLTVTTTRAMLATVRPTVCPTLGRFLRSTSGYRSVRLK